MDFRAKLKEVKGAVPLFRLIACVNHGGPDPLRLQPQWPQEQLGNRKTLENPLRQAQG